MFFSFSILLSKSFHFLLLLSSFLFFNPTTTSAQTLIATSCSETSNYTTNSTFETNLNLLLSSLSFNSPLGFYNTSAGDAPDQAYGLFLCRGDVTLDTCRNCVTGAVQDIKGECPNKKNATAWYGNCFLRYSDTRFFSVMDNSSMVHKSNAVNVTDPVRFKRVLRTMLTNISSVAVNDRRLFSAGEANYTNDQMVYGLVQCTKDISASDCNGCLESAISVIPVCCSGSQGGRVLAKSCNLRYELYPFVNDDSSVPGRVPSIPLTPAASTTNITNSSSTSTAESGGKYIRKKTN